MNPPPSRVVLVLAGVAVLLLGACGQAGPLYLPDQDTHKNKSLKREQRAKATGNSSVPASGADENQNVPEAAPPSTSSTPAPTPNQP